ncbi:hypothetical protein F5X71_29770 [Nocardia brasiliensis]|uniref:Uncharacterized protein n=1 Tax=Nocardia brasiliensis TaxID=37326 RepID=A0A6G9XYC1_NOCBR|nr:hypothetical protein [Nocardia brasiliensis]QIS05939.1 hypothetical protein F5X71_29770 [Nocardia brasiliensis]
MTETATRVPEPALIRGFLVALSAIVAVVVGKNVDVAWIDLATQAYTLVSPLIAGLWIRPAVAPFKKA